MQVDGSVAVVTGAGGGIGAGIARALVASGAKVVLTDLNEDGVSEVAASLPSDSAVFASGDAGSVEHIDEVVRLAESTFGPVDFYFANAGIGGGGRSSFIDRPQSEWREMLATNLDGAVITLQHAARHMRDRAGKGDAFGRLVATSSLASISGTARNEHYAATKGALNSIIRALAVELARYGVTAHCVLPGWIQSEMTDGLFHNDKFVANVMPRIPMRRFGRPEDFAAVAVYIMSNGSSYHTGEMFLIDGAYSIF